MKIRKWGFVTALMLLHFGAGGQVSLPLRGILITSAFGYRIHPVTRCYTFHAGLDLRANKDTVFSILPAIVLSAGYDRLLGVNILLEHGAFQSAYGHLSQIFVLPGDSVLAGTPIGVTGSIGRVTGSHLHFSIQFHHQYIDPLKFLYTVFNNLNQ